MGGMQAPHTCSRGLMGVPLRSAPPRQPLMGRRPLLCEAKPRGVYSTPARPELAPPQQHKAWGVESMGPDLWNTTYYPKGEHAKAETKDWFVIDAAGQTLGRLATLAADHLRGKRKETFTPSVDMGSYVVVTNAEKVTVTGRKNLQKMYYRHSHRPGSFKVESFKHLQKRIPERIVEHAVKGMLPKARLGRHLFTHLKVYKGSEHPHSAQGPVDITPTINLNRAEAAQLVAS